MRFVLVPLQSWVAYDGQGVQSTYAERVWRLRDMLLVRLSRFSVLQFFSTNMHGCVLRGVFQRVSLIVSELGYERTAALLLATKLYNSCAPNI